MYQKVNSRITEACEQQERYARLIATCVKINQQTIQEVEYNSLGDKNVITAFKSFIRKENNCVSLGINKIKRSGGRDSHFVVDLSVLNGFITKNKINIDNVNFDSDNNNTGNNERKIN